MFIDIGRDNIYVACHEITCDVSFRLKRVYHSPLSYIAPSANVVGNVHWHNGD